MNNLNRATLIGNLTEDPEVKTVGADMTVANFGVATNHRSRDPKTKEWKDAPEFHNVSAWRKLAEIAGKYLKKGDRVFLEGRLQTKKWKDKEGNPRSRTEIVADQLILLGKPIKQERELIQQE